jgi:tetratricopeptide (TPR) repeat protein
MIDTQPVPFGSWLEARHTLTQTQPIQDRSGAFQQQIIEPTSRVEEVLGGRFQILEPLGQGGMAHVYRVFDSQRNSERALKLLHEDLAEDSTFQQRFLRAVEVMRSFDHPHLMADVESGEFEGGQLFMSMPLYRGGTLRERAKEGPPHDEIVRWGKQLLSALAALHSKGYVHRDVKPANVLLDHRADVILADFDIARREGDPKLTQTAQQMGSLAYMAPEQQTGTSASPSSDVYSTGILLNELVTGRVNKNTPGEDVEGHLGDAIRKMTELNPENRVTADQAIGILEGSIVGRLPQAAKGRTPADRLSRNWKKPLWIGLALLVLCLGAWVAMRSSGKKAVKSVAAPPGTGGLLDVTALPKFPSQKQLISELTLLGSVDASALWGMDIKTASTKLDRVVQEIEDTRPRLSELHIPGAHKVMRRFQFWDGKLFAIKIQMRALALHYEEALEKWIKRQPDHLSQDHDTLFSYQWEVGDSMYIVHKARDKSSLRLVSTKEYAQFYKQWGEVAPAENFKRQGYDLMWSSYPAEIDEAIKVTEKALKEYPDFGDALSNLCHFYYNKGRLKKAAWNCKEALLRTNENSVKGEVRYYQALLALQKGNTAEGIKRLTKAAEFIPSSWKMYSNIQLHLSGLNGDLNVKVTRRAFKNLFCYGKRGLPFRARATPGEYGFDDVAHIKRNAAELKANPQRWQVDEDARCRAKSH